MAAVGRRRSDPVWLGALGKASARLTAGHRETAGRSAGWRRGRPGWRCSALGGNASAATVVNDRQRGRWAPRPNWRAPWPGSLRCAARPAASTPLVRAPRPGRADGRHGRIRSPWRIRIPIVSNEDQPQNQGGCSGTLGSTAQDRHGGRNGNRTGANSGWPSFGGDQDRGDRRGRRSPRGGWPRAVKRSAGRGAQPASAASVSVAGATRSARGSARRNSSPPQSAQAGMRPARTKWVSAPQRSQIRVPGPVI